MTNINRAFGEDDGSRRTKASGKVTRPGDSGTHKPQRSEQHKDNQDLSDLIQALINDDMGYLKMRLGLDTTLLHLTWTWSSGTHHGHYVYAAVNTWELTFGLQLLLSKRDEVYADVRRPTPDKRRSAID